MLNVRREMMALLLIGNGNLITRDAGRPLLANGCAVVVGERIAEIGDTTLLREKYPAAEFLDAKGGLIMPGLINTHMHFYSSFARGMDLKTTAGPRVFLEILQKLWWRLDRTLNLEDVYYSAAIAMVDCVKNGVTTVFDHHASPGCVRGSLQRIEAAAELLGIRTCLCYEVSDRDGAAVAAAGVAENRDYIDRCHRSGGSLRRGMVGMHASFTLGDELLRQCVALAAELDVGCHVHTAEARSDAVDCRQRYGRGVVERFGDFGVLGPKTITAHCVHVDEAEMELLRSSGAFVVHNPESNMGNAVGCAPVLNMLEQGIKVGLGTDGYTCDMLESLKVANLLHKHESSDPSAAWAQPHAMLFGANADFASACFGEPLGRLTAGALADVIVIDYDPPTPLHAANIDGHVLFGLAGGAVTTTIVNGRILMRDRRINTADVQAIAGKSRELAQALWARF